MLGTGRSHVENVELSCGGKPLCSKVGGKVSRTELIMSLKFSMCCSWLHDLSVSRPGLRGWGGDWGVGD